jgi:hypothetical protein
MPKITTTLPDAKARAKRAHQAVRAGDAVSGAIYDRWLATTLSAAAGQDEEIAAAMFTRLAIACEIMTDMRGWPAGIVAGITPPVRPRKLTYPRAGHGR